VSAASAALARARPRPRPLPLKLLRVVSTAGSVAAIALSVHSAINLRLLRRPPEHPDEVAERVSVLVPARNEEGSLGQLLHDIGTQRGVPRLEVLVLDDASTDRTAALAQMVADRDPRVRVLHGAGPPRGWLGKPAACQQLADQATGTVLVFVDADVRLEPLAVAATVAVLRANELDLVSPYPRQIAVSALERLVQPLLQWSWSSTLPLRIAERSTRASLSAANGQLLAVDAGTYRRAGGHAGVADEVLDDMALVRAVKAYGGRGGIVDGSDLASCRMYESPADLVEGYAKSLWSATGNPAGACALVAVALVVYVLPPLAALRGSRWGAAGYGAAVAGRVVVAHRVRGRVLPDTLAHPVSILVWSWLVARSWHGRRSGTLTWKGRVLV